MRKASDARKLVFAYLSLALNAFGVRGCDYDIPEYKYFVAS